MLAGIAPAQEASAPPAPAGAPAAPGSPAAFTGQIDSYFGLRVGRVELRGMGEGPAQERMRSLLVQEVNAPLDRLKVRRSLQALYATGMFSDLQVEAEREPQGEVTLVFSARPNYFFGAVEVEGAPRRPAAYQLVNAARLPLGELYAREKIDAAVHNLRAVMEDNGYYQAQIADHEQFHPDTQQVDLSFRLVPQVRARVGDVVIEGQPGYSVRTLQRLTGLEPGKPATEPRLTKGLQKLRRKYQKHGRLQAEVAIKDRVYRAPQNRLDYRLEVNQGPVVDIVVSGAHLRRGQLKKLAPVFQEGTVDDDLLNEGARNLRDYFQTRGFFSVRVSYERQTQAAGQKLKVVYHADPGIRQKLVAIHLEGNKTFDAGLIRECMQIKPAGSHSGHGFYSESLLNRDVEAIKDTLYRANGFSQVKIEPLITGGYQGNPGHMLVTLHIDEGPQILAGKVEISGNNSFSLSMLESRLAQEGAGLMTVSGQPFSEANVAQDRDMLMGFYFNHGYPDVQVDVASRPAAAGANRMDVAFTIHEGTRVLVNQVLISGLNYTRPSTIREDLRLRSDIPLSQSDMLETQRSLYDLGLFNQVDMAVQDAQGVFGYKNVLFQLQEAKRWTFNYGIGFEFQTGGEPTNEINSAPAPGITLPKNTIPASSISFGVSPQGGIELGPNAAFEVTRINFRGRDDTISLKAQVGNLEKRVLVSYLAPHWIERQGLHFTFSALYDDSRDVLTFASKRLEGSAQAEQVLTRRGDGQPVSTLLIRYSYRRVTVNADTLAISPPLIPLLSKPDLVGMPSFTYVRDKRDNVLDAHEGNYTTLDFGVSAKVFGSGSVSGTAEQLANGTFTPTGTAANFTRLMAQNSTYAPVWKDPHNAGHAIVFARTTRIGSENVIGTAGLTLPLPERFFAGGADADRGFAFNQAGPRDLTTGFPVGGNAIFLNTFEFRFPPLSLPLAGENIGFVLFHDLGNVFQTGTEMLHAFSHWEQPARPVCRQPGEAQNCRFDYMSQALGTGVRYHTPIGPLRADVSYNLNPPSFPYYVCPVGADCGNPSVLIFQHATLRHFNFVFSIGQSF